MLGPVTAQYADLSAALTARGPAELRQVAPDGGTYAELVAAAAVSHPHPLITPERLAWVLTGIGMRETGLGTSRDLDTPGPGGTGDRGARHRRPNPHLHRVPAVYQGVANLPDEHRRVYVLPLDGRGWGRGLWQWDWEMEAERCQVLLADGTPAWADPRANAVGGAEIFLEKLAALGQERQAIAAYNCGVGGVRAALSAGQNIDANTTGGDYSRWVLARLQEWGAGT